MFLVLAKLIIVGRHNVSLNAFFFLHQKKNSVLTLGHWTNNSAVCLSFLLLKQKHLFFFFNTWRFMYFFLFWKPQQSSKKKQLSDMRSRANPFFFVSSFRTLKSSFVGQLLPKQISRPNMFWMFSHLELWVFIQF